MEETVFRENFAVELVSRVRWRAVLSGLAVTAGCYGLCMGFSWAVGLSTFQPTADHARGLALRNLIWGAIALWLSLFFGSFVAAIGGWMGARAEKTEPQRLKQRISVTTAVAQPTSTPTPAPAR